jgi:hypothetical protein
MTNDLCELIDIVSGVVVFHDPSVLLVTPMTSDIVVGSSMP